MIFDVRLSCCALAPAGTASGVARVGCGPTCGSPEPRANLHADLRAALRGQSCDPYPPFAPFGSALSRMENQPDGTKPTRSE